MPSGERSIDYDGIRAEPTLEDRLLLDLHPGFLEVRAIKCRYSQSLSGQFEPVNLIEIKFEVSATVPDRAGSPDLGLPGPVFAVGRKNHPRSAFRAKDARADNAIGHNMTIGSRKLLDHRGLWSKKDVIGCRWFSRQSKTGVGSIEYRIRDKVRRVAMMTDPAFGIKQKVANLVALQIDTLCKRSSLTPAELDQYHLRSETIAGLYRQLDAIARENFHYARLKAS